MLLSATSMAALLTACGGGGDGVGGAMRSPLFQEQWPKIKPSQPIYR